MTRVVGAALLLLVLALQPGPAWGGSAPAGPSILHIDAVAALCRAHPHARERLWVQGWFVVDSVGNQVEGGLFQSHRAVPVIAVNQWNIEGHWRQYGALLVRIQTRASFGSRALTLHGLLDCASFRFQTDRDPFAPPSLAATYGTTRTRGNGPITTWATAGGLKLTLTVPHTSYPRNALVRVRVIAQNVSTHDLGFAFNGVSNPGVASPQAEVLDSSGSVVYPPAMPYAPPLPGPVGGIEPLRPGQTIGGAQYVIVRGAWVRASAGFTPHLSRDINRATNTVTTRSVQVRLTAEAPPQLQLHGAPGNPVIDVMAPPRVAGGMLLLDYADCGLGAFGPDFDYSFGWVASGRHLIPTCSPVVAWHVRLAWLNHPVAALDYVAPVVAATPTPIPTPTATPTPVLPPSVPPISFNTLLQRASSALAAVYSIHAEGIHTYVDSSSNLDLRIRGDCASRAGHSLPITLQTSVSGRKSGGGRLDEGYLMKGPVLPFRTGTTRVWHRLAATGNRWQPIDLQSDNAWGLPNDPAFQPNPAYTNQICPDLLRLTYLAAPLPSLTHRVLPSTTIDGQRVWHLREGLYWKLDLYLDVGSFRLRRLLLWDGAATAPTHWRVQFDYSRFNRPIRVAIPSAIKSARRDAQQLTFADETKLRLPTYCSCYGAVHRTVGSGFMP